MDCERFRSGTHIGKDADRCSTEPASEMEMSCILETGGWRGEGRRCLELCWMMYVRLIIVDFPFIGHGEDAFSWLQREGKVFGSTFCMKAAAGSLVTYHVQIK